VYSLTMLRLYNYINQHIGTNFTLVHSMDGYDEVSLTADTKIVSNNKELLLSPTELGFATLQQAQLNGGNTIDEAAQIFKVVLENKATDAQQAVVLANSAFAIQTLCPEYNFEECKAIALESIESGNAKDAFEKFLDIYK